MDTARRIEKYLSEARKRNMPIKTFQKITGRTDYPYDNDKVQEIVNDVGLKKALYDMDSGDIADKKLGRIWDKTADMVGKLENIIGVIYK